MNRRLGGSLLLCFVAMVSGDLSARAQSALGLLRREVRGLEDLIRTQKRLHEAELLVARALREKERSTRALIEARTRLGQRRRSLRSLRSILRRRLRVLRRGRRGMLAVLLGARGLSDYRRRSRILARAVSRDLDVLRRYRRGLDEARALATRVAEHEARARALATELVRGRDELGALLARRRSQLAKLRQRGLVRRMRRARWGLRRRLSRLVRSLRSEAEWVSSVWLMAGRLPHPVDGPVAVRFGTVREPTFGTVIRHSGWRYRVPAGSRVAAVFSGEVAFADSLPGYGRLVILDHGSGVHSLYGGLRQVLVKVGARVRAGEAVGSSGAGEGLRGPGVYFEVRVNGRPADPQDWLGPGNQAAIELAQPALETLTRMR